MNALPFGSNPAANYSPTPMMYVVSCRFFMPGTHAVTVELPDESGLTKSKSASVTVTVERGYLFLYLKTSL